MMAARSHSKKSSREKIIASRYEVLKTLGQGGGGRVYLAKDRNAQDQKVALKVVEFSPRQDLTLITRLKNEFATLTLLHHPHLARVYDFGATDQEMYFTSEWVDGEDLLYATAKANLNTVFQLIVQMLRAVDYLHRRGVFHLDLKPANILATHPGRTGELNLKLIDFGLALWKRRGEKAREEFYGTPPYSAPEIMMEQAPSTASDIYSLGILFHRILTGRLPFRSEDPLEIMKEQIYGEVASIENLHPALPDDFGELILRMIAKKPEERLQSPAEVLRKMNESLGENFSLRGPTAPVRILEESDYFFHEDLIQEWAKTFSSAPTLQKIILSGPPGIGKTRLLRRVKELLQLQGISPLLVQDMQSLQDLLPSLSENSASPLFLDLSEKTGGGLFKDLEKLSLPMLAALPDSSGFPSGFRKVSLEPLSLKEIEGFLKKEILEIPIPSWGKILHQGSEGLPTRFETLLKALREEGLLQWSDQGWKWMERKTEPDQLLSRQEFRWRERLKQIQEVLRFSRTGLNAQTLEGILNLDAGALEDKLQEWIREGEIYGEEHDTGRLYFSLKIPTEENALKGKKDFPWITRELEHLYEKGEFEKGYKWSQLLFPKGAEIAAIPENTLLVCARLAVAVGHAQEALQKLPRRPPQDAGPFGMFHEIRARAHFLKGELPESEREIDQSEKAFESIPDAAGLSRVFNLKGSVYKRQGQYEKAEKFFDRSLKEAARANDFYLQGVSQMHRATLAHEQGRLNQAHQAYQQALELAKKAGHPLLACYLSENWVNLLYHMGKSREALTLSYDWLQQAIRSRYPGQQAAAFNYLALLAGQDEHRDMQLAYLNQAISLLESHFDLRLKFQTHINRGYVFLDLKKFAPAQLDAEAALGVAEQGANPTFAAWAYLLLGKVVRDRPKPDWEEAGRFLNEAHAAAVETKNRQILWEIDYERGIYAKKKNEIEKAQGYFLSAQKELEGLLEEMPEALKPSYLRDRKLDKIQTELESLQ